MSGGAGNDIFRYQSNAESTSASRDGIQDLALGDKIDLSPIDAISATTQNDAFTFIGNAAFGNHAGELRVANSGSVWTIQGDVNGDGASDFESNATVSDAHAVTQADFIL
jgi:hypothetical protein